jgi:hypothetical protein
MMSEDFDPYHKWLGIPPKDQPPHHYRLLGIDLFETDPEVIQAAAERQMAHVRKFQLGQHTQTSQKLLNEIAAAKLCLLRSDKREVYDSQLHRELGTKAAPPPIPESQALETATSGLEQFSLREYTWAGKAAVAAGLVLVLVARSCTTLGERAVGRAQAKVDLFENQLQEDLDESQMSEPVRELRDAADNRSVGNTRVEGAIEVAGDQDTFEFTASTSGRLRIDLTATTGGLDGLVRLYDGQRKLIEENDDGGSNRNPRLVTDVMAGQTYFIQVMASRSVSRNSANATGSYKLEVDIGRSSDDFQNDFDNAEQLTFNQPESDKRKFERWKVLEEAARNATHNSQIRAYWYQWLFLLGSLCLVSGLLLVAFYEAGLERWLCLIMVAIIVFSLFVGTRVPPLA